MIRVCLVLITNLRHFTFSKVICIYLTFMVHSVWLKFPFLLHHFVFTFLRNRNIKNCAGIYLVCYLFPCIFLHYIPPFYISSLMYLLDQQQTFICFGLFLFCPISCFSLLKCICEKVVYRLMWLQREVCEIWWVRSDLIAASDKWQRLLGLKTTSLKMKTICRCGDRKKRCSSSLLEARGSRLHYPLLQVQCG